MIVRGSEAYGIDAVSRSVITVDVPYRLKFQAHVSVGHYIATALTMSIALTWESWSYIGAPPSRILRKVPTGTNAQASAERR